MSTTEGSSTGTPLPPRPRPVFGYGLIVVVIAALVAGAAVAAVAATSSPRRGPDLGPFAGYFMPGRALRSVSAAWVVPRIRDGSPAGAASAWIGAQAPGIAARAPFIQVGTNDLRTVSGVDYYEAFWSDTDHGFAPVRLFAVRPGDRVHASLTLVGGAWHVSLGDSANGASRTVVTVQEGAARFNEVEWLQEDPGRRGPVGIHELRFPYTPISIVRFRALRVDGRAATASRIVSQWMSLSQVDLAPTSLRDDSFSIVPRRLGAPARRYLRLVAPEDDVQERFIVALALWRAATPGARIAPAAGRLVAVIDDYDAALARPGWPASTASARAQVRVRGAKVAALARRAPAVPRASRASFESEWLRTIRPLGIAARALRRALGAPEYTPFNR